MIRHIVYRLPVVLLVLGLSQPARAQVVFGDSGFEQKRDYFSQLPFEHIDPLTGNLLLTFTDLVLPGNAGFDLRIQRTYNSKIYRDYQNSGDTLKEDSWAGIGWSMHMGRVFHARSFDGADPIIEMPDGSQHHAFRHLAPPAGCGNCYITRDYWVYDKATATLYLPNGVIYTFGHTANTGWAGDIPAEYATQIQDAFGNSLVIEYYSAPADGMSKITQNLGGGQTREVTFAVSGGFKSLATMTYAGRVWTYQQVVAYTVANSRLEGVRPPLGTGWTFSYATAAPPRNELIVLTTPHGGTIEYRHEDQTFFIGNTSPLRSRAVTRRTTGGRLVVPGVWTYAYAQGSGKNQTVITGPSNVVTREFLGVGNFATQGNTWSIGALSKRVVAELPSAGGATLETEELTWTSSAPISWDQEIIGLNHDADIRVPLMWKRKVTRGSATLNTIHDYRSSSFNDYGRAHVTTETGNRGDVRTTTREFQYGFTPYIVDKPLSETVSVGSESFTTTYGHDLANGFRTSDNRYGVNVTFQKTPTGDVYTRTDANGHVTTFAYSWGAESSIQTPEYAVTRNINPDGTVNYEIRRGFTTNFSYDTLMRPTVTAPPGVNQTTRVYDNSAGTYTRVERGSSYVQTTVDGFGRVTGTQDVVGDEDNAALRRVRASDLRGLRLLDGRPRHDSHLRRAGTGEAADQS